MKKPIDYEIKSWLYDNRIKGLIVHYKQVGTDSFVTNWELFPILGYSRMFKDFLVKDLVVLEPTHDTILHLDQKYQKEVEEYRTFIEKESEDYEKYLRLKEKFE